MKGIFVKKEVKNTKMMDEQTECMGIKGWRTNEKGDEKEKAC